MNPYDVFNRLMQEGGPGRSPQDFLQEVADNREALRRVAKENPESFRNIVGGEEILEKLRAEEQERQDRGIGGEN